MLGIVKKIYNSRLFQAIVICLVGGILLIVVAIGEYIDSNKVPVDYNSVSGLANIKKGDVIEGDISMNFGVYESIETKRSGSTTSVRYRYIIPVGEKDFIGIDLSDPKVVAEMDKMTKETYEVYKGNAESTNTTVHFKGKVSKLSNEDYDYFKRGMNGLGYTDNEIEQYCSKLYIQNRTFNNSTPMIIIGVILIVISIVLIVVTLNSVGKQSI